MWKGLIKILVRFINIRSGDDDADVDTTDNDAVDMSEDSQ
jgi:hypothetical protein